MPRTRNTHIKFFHTKEEFRRELDSRPLEFRCASEIRCKDRDTYNNETGKFDKQMALKNWCSVCLYAEINGIEVKSQQDE